MSPIELIEQIKSLTPDQQREVSAHVERLATERPRVSEGLVDRINARRERLASLYGPFEDSTDDIRRLRDEGR